MVIEKLAVDIDDKGYKLDELDSYQLYQLSYKNGIYATYLQYSGKIGSIVCIRPQDIHKDYKVTDFINSIRVKMSIRRQRTVQPAVANLACNVTILLIKEKTVLI